MQARLFLAACASATLLTAAACNTDNTANQATAKPNTATTAATGTKGTSDEARPIAITGCLQKDGSDYILTQINEPPKGEPVAQQDVNEAEHTYRLTAKNTTDDDWDKLVGSEVRVSGTLAKGGDVAERVGTTGSNNATDHPEIRERDLAKVDVSDIQVTRAACGGHAMKPRLK